MMAVLDSFLESPMFGLAAGLLSGAESGSGLGGSLLRGLAASQSQQALANRNADREFQRQYQQAQIAALQQKQVEAERQRRAVGALAQQYPQFAPLLAASPSEGISLIGSMLAPPDRTSLQQNLIAAGLEPDTLEFQQELLGAVRRPATQITMTTAPKLPSGFIWQTPEDPAASGYAVQPITGGAQDPTRITPKEFATRRDRISKLESDLAKVEHYRRLLLSEGPALFERSELGSNLLTSRGDVERVIADMRNMQTLQKDEAERLEREIKVPIGVTAQLTPRSVFTGPLDQITEKLQREREQIMREMGVQVPDPVDPKTAPNISRGRAARRRYDPATGTLQ